MSFTRVCALKRSVTHLGLVALALVGSWVWGVARTDAAIHTLTDLNSIVRIDDASQSGMFDWVVDGSTGPVDHLAKATPTSIPGQWYWFRIGESDGEAPINTLGPVTATQVSPRDLTLTYTHGSGLTVQLTYQLLGQPTGFDGSHITENVRITNPAGNPAVTFHLFQYTDFDLNGSPGDDTVVQLDARTMQQFDGGVSFAQAETSTAPPLPPAPSHFELATFPFTRDKLNNATPTTLCDGIATSSAEGACTAGTALGPGDVTFAWQWDFSLPTNSLVTVNIDKDIAATVPQPLSLLILGLGFVALALWGRGRGGLPRLV
jgi:hypothetical protein